MIQIMTVFLDIAAEKSDPISINWQNNISFPTNLIPAELKSY